MSAKKMPVMELPEMMKLVERINKATVEEVAKEYGTHPSTLTRFLNKNGFQVRYVWGLTSAGKEAIHGAAPRNHERNADDEKALDGFFKQLAEVEAS